MGLPVALVDVLPWNNGHPAADAPIEELNREIERIAEDEGVPMLPFHDTLEDPDEPGTMSAGLDGRRRPSVDRGLPPPRRAGVRRASRRSASKPG